MSDKYEQIAASVADLKEAVQDHAKSETEKREEFERRMGDIMDAKQQADRSKPLSDDAPLDPVLDKSVSQGSLFKGLMKMPFAKALSLSPDNPAVIASGDADQLRGLQDLHDAVVIKFLALAKKHDETTARTIIAKDQDFHMYVNARHRAGYHEKADEILNPLSGATGGTNLDFTLLSAQLLDLVRLELIIAPQFRQVPLTRPNQAFPALRSDSMGVWGTGGTDPPVQDSITVLVPGATFMSNPTFGQVVFAAQHCMGYSQLNDDMVEDSVIPILPLLREQMARAIARAKDRSCLDGDNVTTHMDTDVAAGAANDFRKAVNGLRNMLNTSARRSSGHVVDAGGATNALTSALLHTVRKKTGIYGRSPSELFYIMSMSSYYQLIANAEFRTADKYAQFMTNRTGVIDIFAGSDIVLSEFVREDLDATGVNGATNNDFTVVYVANRTRFMYGNLNTVNVEATRWAPMLYTIVQSDVRFDFQPIEALSSGVFTAIDAPGAMIRNLDPTA